MSRNHLPPHTGATNMRAHATTHARKSWGVCGAAVLASLALRCGPVGSDGSTRVIPDAGSSGSSSGGGGSGGSAGSGAGGSSAAGSADAAPDALPATGDAGPTPPGLHVSGNHLVDNGATV